MSQPNFISTNLWSDAQVTIIIQYNNKLYCYMLYNFHWTSTRSLQIYICWHPTDTHIYFRAKLMWSNSTTCLRFRGKQEDHSFHTFFTWRERLDLACLVGLLTSMTKDTSEENIDILCWMYHRADPTPAEKYLLGIHEQSALNGFNQQMNFSITKCI